MPAPCALVDLSQSAAPARAHDTHFIRTQWTHPCVLVAASPMLVPRPCALVVRCPRARYPPSLRPHALCLISACVPPSRSPCAHDSPTIPIPYTLDGRLPRAPYPLPARSVLDPRICVALALVTRRPHLRPCPQYPLHTRSMAAARVFLAHRPPPAHLILDPAPCALVAGCPVLNSHLLSPAQALDTCPTRV
jgi:hypothetical protein